MILVTMSMGEKCMICAHPMEEKCEVPRYPKEMH
jgi:hypothetical protein